MKFYIVCQQLPFQEVLHALSVGVQRNIKMESTCKTLDILLLISLAVLTVFLSGSAGVVNNKIIFWDLSPACFDRCYD